MAIYNAHWLLESDAVPLAFPWMDLATLTGLEARQLPKEIREPSDTITDVRSFVALCGGDESMNPHEVELLVGSATRFAQAYGVSVRQMWRYLAREDAAFVHRLPGGLLATVASSAETHRMDIAAEKPATYAANANRRWERSSPAKVFTRP